MINNVKKLTQARNVFLTSRGNNAIRQALRLMKSLGKEVVLVPDQGGWLTFRQFPLELGMFVVELETDNALLLPDKIPDVANAVLLMQDFGGYFVSQPLDKIRTVCSQKNIPIILDVSASIGTPCCDQKFADILVGSFGESKPVNACYGGFISTNKDYSFKETFEPIYSKQVEAALRALPSRLAFLQDKRMRVLSDLEGSKVIHKDKEGINVVVAFDSEEKRLKLIDYCHSNKLEYTECPRYIRVLCPAVSIEIKRL